MVVAIAYAGCGGARASLHGTPQGSPARAGGEECGNGHNGQKSNDDAHVFYWEARESIVADFGQSETMPGWGWWFSLL
jgi:hypothetical protein